MNNQYRSSTFIQLLLLFFLVAVSLPLQATTLKKLYEVSVPVFSQSSKEQAEATNKAFEQLLIRVTGKKNIAELEEGQALLRDARRYIRSFRYEVIEPKPVEEPQPVEEPVAPLEFNENQFMVEPPLPDSVLPVEPLEPQPTQNLVIIFDEKAVKNSLWKSKLPVWGKTRPATLIWLAIQDEESRRLVDVSSSQNLIEQLEENAKRRGLPVLYPLLDLEDQININVTDVWGGFKDPVLRASERYQPEAIVAARVYFNPQGVWESRWSFYQGSEEQQWRTVAMDLSTTLEQAVDELADRLAERYAHVPTSGDENRTLVYVADINNLADYNKVSRYLSGLSVVKQAFVTQVNANELVYQLDLRGSRGSLKQAISLSKVLLEVEDPFAVDLMENRFNYRLSP